MKPATRGFQTPPEVIRFLEDKSLAPQFSHQDATAEEHAYRFMVSKAIELELTEAFHRTLGESSKEGEGFDSWHKRIIPELQRLGWYGKRKVDDPTGKWDSKIVDFSQPARLHTIFWSNIRAARAAGQWERIQRTKAGLPYLVYVRTTSAHPREQHLAWVGIILPVDDPFWATHFPPNGWRCACSVRQITRGQYDRLKDQDGYTTEAPTIEEKTFVNRRTGEVSKIPVGIDPGWQTNPGLSRAKTLVDNVAGRLESAGEEAARARVAEIVNSPAPKILLGLNGARFDMPVAVSGALRESWKASSSIIAVSNEVMRRKIYKHAPVDVDSFARVQQLVDSGEQIDEGRGEENRRVFVARIEGAWWKLVLAKTRRGYMRIATLLHLRSGEVERLRRKAKGS